MLQFRLGKCPHPTLLQATEQGFQRFVALLAAGVTLLLVLADGPILEASKASEQHIDQVVLKPVILVSDKGDKVQGTGRDPPDA